MADFNPDEYLAAKDAAAPTSSKVGSAQLEQFDPDQYLAQKGSTRFDIQQEKYGTPGQTALATIEGAGRGLTLGLSDVAATKLGITSPEDLAGRSEANPIAATAGSLAGAGALIGATGGAGALTEGLGAGARIAGTAAEGAVFGAGNAVSDYAMGDPSLNAQKVAMHVGLGAILGGGLGATGELASAYLPAATGGLKKGLDKLHKMAVNATEEGKLASRIAPGWTQTFREGLLNGSIEPKTAVRDMTSNLSEIVSNAKQAANDLYEKAAPTNISQALKDVPVETAKHAAGNTVDYVAKQALSEESELGASTVKVLTHNLDSLKASVEKAATADEVNGALRKFATEFDKGIKFDKLPTAAQQIEQDVLRDVRQNIRGQLSDPAVWGDAAMHYAEMSGTYNAYKTSLKNFQTAFMKAEASPSGARRYVVDPSKVQSFVNNIAKPGQDLRRQYLEEYIAQTQNLAQSSENYAGFIKGADAISGHVEKLAKKHGELAATAEALSAAKSAAGGPSLLAEGAGGAVAHALGVPHPVVGAAITALEAYKAIRNPYTAGANLANVFNKLEGLGGIIDNGTARISDNARSIFSQAARGATISGISEAGYEKRVKRIEELSRDTAQFADHLEQSTGPLHEAAPNVTQNLNAVAARGVQFLASKIPRPNTEFPLAQKWGPTRAQKTQFNRYYEVVNNPLIALKQIRSGALSNETMEVLNTVYPDLLKEMRQEVGMHLSKPAAKHAPYSTRIALSKFMGMPMDQSLMQPVINANQAAYILPKAQAMTSPRGHQSGLLKLDASGRAETSSYRLEKARK